MNTKDNTCGKFLHEMIHVGEVFSPWGYNASNITRHIRGASRMDGAERILAQARRRERESEKNFFGPSSNPNLLASNLQSPDFSRLDAAVVGKLRSMLLGNAQELDDEGKHITRTSRDFFCKWGVAPAAIELTV